MTEITKIKKLVKLMKEQGIQTLKVGEIEIVFSLNAVFSAAPKKAAEPKFEQAVSNDPGLSMPPDDELLFFATDHFDELREQRKAQ